MPLIQDALADTPVLLLNGARQTGKSTLARSLAAPDNDQQRRYLTLDDQVTLAAAKNNPDGFIAGLSNPVILDEVQRAPELFLAIKAAVDRERIPGKFFLTGSANVLLLPKVADSLAGRMEILSLWPLSSGEIANAADFNRADWLFNGDLGNLTVPPCDRADLIAALLRGGFPEVQSRNERRRASWFDSYLEAIMKRDVRDLANLEQLLQMPHLLQLLASRSASLLNFAELARSSGLPQTTLKRYLILLETLFMVYRLPAWARNPGKRLTKSPKVFLPDSGLLAHLMNLSPAALEQKSGLPGGLVETFVLSELMKHLAFSSQRLTLWHYRTQSDIEVDFLLENRLGQLTGIEVKASSQVDAAAFKGLRHLQETEGAQFQRGIVLYGGRDVVPFGEKLFAVPLSMWWASAHR
jgi:predicted AAA+ superfamily ATPase